MNLLKSLLRGLASVGLKFGLFFMATISASIMVFGTSTPLKQAMQDSKLYDNLVNNVVTSDNTSDIRSNVPDLYNDQALVKEAANKAFTPSFIQSSVEQVIDSTYAWLSGKTARPDFKIDLAEPKTHFASAVADSAMERARQLPPCNLQQIRELSAMGNIDPFTAPCLPPGVDIASVRNKVFTDLVSHEEFLKNNVISADSFTGKEQGDPTFENWSEAPKVFNWIMLAPWFLAGLALLSAAALIALYDQKRRAVRAIAITLIGSGVFLLIGTWVLTFALHQVNTSNNLPAQFANNGLQANFIAIIDSLTQALGNKLYMFGVIYIILGAGILVTLHFTKGKPKTQDLGSTPTDLTTNTTTPPIASPGAPETTPEQKP